MYRRVAAESPHGDGSISMLENLLSRWKGKLFVLALLGFATTSFIITITLSAADATAHIVENPFVVVHLHFLHHRIPVTIVLISVLGAIFLRGFKDAIGIAVFLVAFISRSTLQSWQFVSMRSQHTQLCCGTISVQHVQQEPCASLRTAAIVATHSNIRRKKKKNASTITFPQANPILFFEVTPGDASEFSGVLKIRGESVDGFKILRTESPAGNPLSIW
jgi:hypothetical protein